MSFLQINLKSFSIGKMGNVMLGFMMEMDILIMLSDFIIISFFFLFLNYCKNEFSNSSGKNQRWLNSQPLLQVSDVVLQFQVCSAEIGKNKHDLGVSFILTVDILRILAWPLNYLCDQLVSLDVFGFGFIQKQKSLLFICCFNTNIMKEILCFFKPVREYQQKTY